MARAIPLFKAAADQVAVYMHEEDEQRAFTGHWMLPSLDLPAAVAGDPVHIRVEFDPPQIHLSPVDALKVAEIGKETLKLIIERRIETEPAWMRRFNPPYKQLPRIPALAEPSSRGVGLRALGLDALADYARFLTHYPPARVWEIADRLRRASTRFMEPSLVDTRVGWDKRIPPRGELRRRLLELPPGGPDEISLLELVGGDSASLVDVMEQWPERFGPRRRLLDFDEKTLPEAIWDELLGARVNASLSPDTSDTTERLMAHLLPLLQGNALAVAYVLALMGFTLLQRPLGLSSLLDPQLQNAAIPIDMPDEELEHSHDIAAAWIESHTRSRLF